jgi:ribosomal subunit interface protein
MRIPVQISFHGLERSDALEDAVRGKVEHLEHLAGNITSCRVVVDLLQKHKHQGRPFGVRIDLTLPGRELIVDRVQHEDAFVALRDAFDAMKRQLEDAVQQRRGQEKQHAREWHGEVVRIDAQGGYGFIRTPDGQEYYFGRDNIAGGTFEGVEVGTAVQFLAEPAGEGLQAKRVSLGRHHAP